MSTLFAATLKSIVPPPGSANAIAASTRHARSRVPIPLARPVKAAASTFSDPNATADPAEVYAVGETVDDGEHIVSAAAWIVARQSSLDPDSRCGVFAMYDHPIKCCTPGMRKTRSRLCAPTWRRVSRQGQGRHLC